jgi:hypothetical protein
VDAVLAAVSTGPRKQQASSSHKRSSIPTPTSSLSPNQLIHTQIVFCIQIRMFLVSRIRHYFTWIRILPSPSKKNKKTLDFYNFFYFFLTFYLGKVADVNVPSEINKQKTLKKNYLLLTSCQSIRLRIRMRKSLVGIRIRTKMSGIHSTVRKPG